jgi:hypothetical protein
MVKFLMRGRFGNNEKEIKAKYHAKGFPKQYPGSINNYLRKVVSIGPHYRTCRVDSENFKEILYILNIPKKAKSEIREIITEYKVVFVSEAAFESQWSWDAKYLIWDEKKEILYQKVKGGVSIADGVARVLKWKYREKNCDRPSFVLPPEGISKFREYYRNVNKSYIPSKKRSIFKIDVDNCNELLPLLRIPEYAQKEINDLIESNKKNTFIVSPAAYAPKWKSDNKYLVFELREKDKKFIKSLFGREKIKMKYQYSRFFLPLFTPERFPRSFKKKILEYKKKIKKMPFKHRFDWVLIVDKENMEELSPALYIPGKVKDDIENLVNNGKVVIITEAAFQPEWKWEEKYLVFDEKKTRK